MFLSYKIQNFSCYTVWCFNKKKELLLFFVDKQTRKESKKECFKENKVDREEDPDIDAESCWYDEWLEEELCIV